MQRSVDYIVNFESNIQFISIIIYIYSVCQPIFYSIFQSIPVGNQVFKVKYCNNNNTQMTITCPRSTIETVEYGVKHVES